MTIRSLLTRKVRTQRHSIYEDKRTISLFMMTVWRIIIGYDGR